jgi:nucleoside-diphosphate-sugar epimerase
VSSIHLADAAAAVVAALHGPIGTFNVVDDEPLTKREYAEALANAAGKTMWLRGPGRAGLRRPPHLADPLRARQQRTIPDRNGMGAALSQRPGGLDRHRNSAQHSRIAA